MMPTLLARRSLINRVSAVLAGTVMLAVTSCENGWRSVFVVHNHTGQSIRVKIGPTMRHFPARLVGMDYTVVVPPKRATVVLEVRGMNGRPFDPKPDSLQLCAGDSCLPWMSLWRNRAWAECPREQETFLFPNFRGTCSLHAYEVGSGIIAAWNDDEALERAPGPFDDK